MKSTFQVAAAAVGLAAMASAHMEMTSPAPFKSKANTNAAGDVDFDMVAPLDKSGSNFPCKGYHSLFGTPAGAPTAEWAAGSSQSFTVTGGANHNGGSCQASLSYDGGNTFKVIHSYQGNCPPQGESSFDFTVPSDAPGGDAIFAWTWFNQVGNREMYMNCAAVTINGGSSAKRDLSALPDLFVANVDNGCIVPEGTDVEFPNPGSEVTGSGTGAPEGSCGPSGGAPSQPSEPAPEPVEPAPEPVEPAPEPVEPAPQPVEPSPEPVEPSPAPVPTDGGVFITAPPAAEPVAPTGAPIVENPVSSAPVVDVPAVPTNTPVAPPNTLVTSTRPVEAAPTAPVTPPAPAPVTPPTGGSGSFAAGEACTEEGVWNCVGGSQFQRCASGQWSALVAMAAGTGCTPGQSADLQVLRLRKRSVYGQPLIRA